jgi:hypothetical protein
MIALSIRQPWAWAILAGIKNVENRSWTTNYRGRVAIHASLTCKSADFDSALMYMRGRVPIGTELPDLDDLSRGGVIGVATLVEVHEPWPETERPWHEDPCYGWRLTDPVPCDFVPWTGKLRLFDVPTDLIRLRQ